MKKATMIVLGCIIASTLSANVMADIVFGDGGASLQGILDAVTIDPTGDSSIDVLTDAMSDDDDSYWSVSASGSSIATLIIELAAVQQSGNTFGIFEPGNPSNKIELFNGSEFYGTKTVTVLDDFTVLVNYVPAGNFGTDGFGYYLGTPTGVAWYSDTALNIDDWDHMLAYQGNDSDVMKLGMFAPGIFQSNEYVLAFEDLLVNSPKLPVTELKYDDFIVLVESVTPVPEPATMVLLGLGCLVLRKCKC